MKFGGYKCALSKKSKGILDKLILPLINEKVNMFNLTFSFIFIDFRNII